MRRAHRSRTLLLGLAALLSVLALVVPLAAQSGAAGHARLHRDVLEPGEQGHLRRRASIRRPARLSTPTLAAEIRNPSFLAASADGRFLYAVSEVDAVAGKPGGAVAGYAIDKAAGTLKPLNTQSTVGGGPVPRQRRRQDGVRGQLRRRQHRRLSDAGRRLAEAGVDLRAAQGLERQPGPPEGAARARASRPIRRGSSSTCPTSASIRCSIYRIDAAAGTIAPATPPFAAITPAGSGPRHIAISRDGKHAYVITEMFCTIGVFDRNATSGALSPIQTISTLPAGQAVEKGFSTAEVLLHPSGKFLYGSNRGHNSLVVYAVDASSGKLTLRAARADRRQDAARLQHRSERHVPRRRQPGQRHGRRLPDRSGDRAR